ncbi:non-ribosomal peptide synthetase [Thioflexithrix psekupsensis]|uniref:Carrier domain-containing protein n=1 Tax=Thioflexithrix psekupsensis TaxID=1570016 RepID=A0A251X3G5_9GAMM|nr:non-ribosomal peptide synthetase [Thioflexithrix psekupsensis]OUD11718.1 hypothetical protein TPSD3_16845 [Thioflexithrix psekupsensis]
MTHLTNANDLTHTAYLPELTPSFIRQIEGALFNENHIREAFAVQITPTTSELPHLRLALVSTQSPLDTQRLRTQLQTRLTAFFPELSIDWENFWQRVHFLPVTALPRTAQGDVDTEALKQLPYLEDEDLCQQWTHALRPLAAPEPLTVVAHEQVKQQARWHLSDVLDEDRTPHHSIVISPQLAQRTSQEAQSEHALSYLEGVNIPLPADRPLTLPQVLKYTAQQSYAQGVRYLHLDGREEWQSYAELAERAAMVLARLREQGCQTGDKIILQLDHNADFIPIFWGCLAGGFIPVPTHVPPLYEADSAPVQLLGNIWQRLARPLIVTRRGLLNDLQKLTIFDTPPRILSVEDLTQGDPDHHWHHADPHDVAILLFTSGSTGQPKGVMLTHSTLINNVASSAAHNRFTAEEISLNWLHLDHVGSLVRCCIRDVYVGSQQIHAPTELFLHNPLIWLDWIDRYRVTYAWAPNFALGLINERAEAIKRGHWDLRCVKSLLSVAEPIVPQTAQAFARLLSQHGFNPKVMQAAWGMSETGAAVVFSHDYLQRLASPDTPYVEVGQPVPNFALRLLDQEGHVVPQGTIGLLQIKGPMITVGYYENPELTAQVLAQDGWFDTGDLGVVHQGRLTITGRQKEMIIINGLNHYSHEIEAIVETVEGVEASFTVACAIRRQESNTDDLLIFFHTRHHGETQADVIRRIQGQLVRKLGVMPAYVLPVAKSDIPKSSIGKLQRNPLKQRFENGEFNALVKQVDLWLANEQTLPAWFYRLNWQAYQLPSAQKIEPIAAEKTLYLCFNDECGLAQSFIKTCDNNALIIQVEKGESFQILAENYYRINPDNVADYHQLFAHIPSSILHTYWLHGWQYTEQAPVIQNSDDWHKVQALGLNSLLHGVKQWLAQNPDSDQTLQLICYSSYSESVLPDDLLSAPQRGMLDAWLKTVNHEQPRIQARHLDLLPADLTGNLHALQQEIQHHSLDVRLVWRKGIRYVSRLQAVDLNQETKKTMPLVSGGFYLISGGLGDIGVALARLLLMDYKARLLLIGRTALPPRAEWQGIIEQNQPVGKKLALLQDLEALAGEIRYLAADITDFEKLNHTINDLEQHWQTPLAGVIHLARVTHQALITEETSDTLAAMLRPKVQGTWVLDQLLQTRPEAIFIHFSSVSSVLGTYNMGAYAAANGFLDHFAQYQRQKNRKSYCFGWSIWEEVGQDRAYQLREVSRARGYHTLSTTQGLTSLRIGLLHDQPYLTVGLDGYNAWLRQHVQHPAESVLHLTAAVSGQVKLSALRQYAAKLMIPDPFGQNTSCDIRHFERLPLLEPDQHIDRAQLSRWLSQSQRGQKMYARDELEQQIAQIWETILDTYGLGIHDNFFELGGHSLLATQIMFRLHKTLGINLPQRVLFENPTIAKLAEKCRTLNNDTARQLIEKREQAIDKIPLSFAQQRLWFLEQLEGQTAAYNIHVLLDIHGHLDRYDLQSSLNTLLQRHAILRTAFRTDAEQMPYQFIDPHCRQCSFDYSDLRLEKNVDSILDTLKHQAAEHLFHLNAPPLLYLHWVQLADERHQLLLTMHHIISDGWSIRLLCHELFQCYGALRQGKAIDLPELTIDYADYTLWQRAYLQGEVLDQKLAYWQRQLANAPILSTLPTDRPRPAIQTYHGTEEQLVLPKTLSNALQQSSRQAGVTLFMTLFSAFQVLLYRYSGQSDLVIGMPSAGRSHPQLEKLVGFFIDTIALRTPLDSIVPDCSADQLTFTQVLQKVQQLAIEAYNHEEVPFEKIVEVLQPQRNLSYTPIFQIWFNMLNLEAAHFDSADVQIEYIPTANTLSKFDITLYVKETVNGIELRLVYNPDLYEATRIVEFLQQYHHLLTQVVAHPEARLHEYSLRTPHARLPDPRMPLPCVYLPTVLDQLATQAAQSPAHFALVGLGETWDYRTLWGNVCRLAAALRQAGVAQNEVVAVYGDRSPWFVAALLGIWHCGAAFTILNPHYPPQRLAQFAKTARIHSLLLLTPDCPVELKNLSVSIYQLPDLLNASISITENDLLAISPKAKAHDVAYVAFTTGSTGEPKAILGAHYPLSHFFDWYVKSFGFNADDRFSLISGLAHDPLLRDMFTAYYCGACVYIPYPDELAQLEPLANWIHSHHITVSHLTPAMADVLSLTATTPLISLKHVVFGGDRLSRHALNQFRQIAPNAQCFNGYGATETPQLMSLYHLDNAEYENAPLGYGIDGVQLLILTANGQLAGVGERGEIYIRSPYLSLGYLDEEQTAQRFLLNPFRSEEKTREDRLYRTGDAGYYLADGRVLFLGRIDNQVKIRGFRVELGEIESRLRMRNDIEEIVVDYRLIQGSEERQLVAYLVPQSGQSLDEAELTRQLRLQLPDYMIPVAYVSLARLPLNANGKVNRAALPDPVLSLVKSEVVAPRTLLEKQLAAAWSKVLNRDAIGVHDNFFDLGGHSMLALRLMSHIEKQTGQKASLSLLFQTPTIAGLAAAMGGESKQELTAIQAVQTSGKNPPLFFLSAPHYARALSNAMGSEQPFYGLNIFAFQDMPEDELTMQVVAQRFVKEMKQIQATGPYFIGAYCGDARIAMAVVHHLSELGEPIAFFGVIDFFKWRQRRWARHAANVKRFGLLRYGLHKLRTRFNFSLIMKRLLIKLSQRFMGKNKAEQKLPQELKIIAFIRRFEAARSAYRITPYPGQITFFLSEEILPEHAPDYAALGEKGSEVCLISGFHLSLFEQPHLDELAQAMMREMERRGDRN